MAGYEYAIDRQQQWDRRAAALELRKSGLTYLEIAKRFNVSATTARNLVEQAQRDVNANRVRPVCPPLSRQKEKALREEDKNKEDLAKAVKIIARRFEAVIATVPAVFSGVRKITPEGMEEPIELILSQRQFELIKGERTGGEFTISGAIVRVRTNGA